ncbi:hypothetical protein BFJ66_g6341 [Fusarium oxysporum f. sp. cepae]|uniref:Uncharacterized protein n=1 Tax=Fusarium oxysporum f. sp. cepae TaxID=396571 RepID=A0A3L6P6S1_FUSOX|nr:hypothetical protein BFJ65_g1479 [Fusarium oxysporum f. sp. cepae]RKK50855.1 hypothetical protein BFJ66_g6341 [Fusarium oxysporum f. sp. cepae]RKK59520.1 hypothetical protein BFJ67_g2631 [Fusarium oxysporum f. sp. cepae]
MIMTTPIVETTPTLGVLGAEHAEMREVSLNINVENEMDTNSDVEMEYNAGVPVQGTKLDDRGNSDLVKALLLHLP